MEIAVFIQNIQEERAEVALHIFSNPSDNGAMNGKALTERFEMTDRALEEMPTWPNVKFIRKSWRNLKMILLILFDIINTEMNKQIFFL